MYGGLHRTIIHLQQGQKLFICMFRCIISGLIAVGGVQAVIITKRNKVIADNGNT